MERWGIQNESKCPLTRRHPCKNVAAPAPIPGIPRISPKTCAFLTLYEDVYSDFERILLGN